MSNRKYTLKEEFQTFYFKGPQSKPNQPTQGIWFSKE